MAYALQTLASLRDTAPGSWEAEYKSQYPPDLNPIGTLAAGAGRLL